MTVSCENCYEYFDNDLSGYVVEVPRTGRRKPERWNAHNRACAVAIVKEQKSQIREHAQWLLSQVKIRKNGR